MDTVVLVWNLTSDFDVDKSYLWICIIFRLENINTVSKTFKLRLRMQKIWAGPTVDNDKRFCICFFANPQRQQERESHKKKSNVCLNSHLETSAVEGVWLITLSRSFSILVLIWMWWKIFKTPPSLCLSHNISIYFYGTLKTTLSKWKKEPICVWMFSAFNPVPGTTLTLQLKEMKKRTMKLHGCFIQNESELSKDGSTFKEKFIFIEPLKIRHNFPCG